MLRFQLPQITRIFTASSLWAGITMVFVVNFYARFNIAPSYWNKLEAALLQPFSSANHRILAEELWQQGLRDTAKKEAVLGATTIASLEQSSEDLEQKYGFWQSIILTRPDYRDAYITLAALAYQLGKTEEAKKYLASAQQLDPNSQIIQRFLTYILI